MKFEYQENKTSIAKFSPFVSLIILFRLLPVGNLNIFPNWGIVVYYFDGKSFNIDAPFIKLYIWFDFVRVPLERKFNISQS